MGQYPNSKVELQNAVNQAIAAGHFAEAEYLLEKLRNLYGNQPDFCYINAYLLFQLEKYEAAILQANSAIEMKTKLNAEAYQLIGFAQRNLLNYREAITALEMANALALQEKCLKESDFVGRNYLSLGQSYLYVGDINKAKAAYLAASSFLLERREKCEAYSSYLLCLHYDSTVADEQLFAEHCKYKNLLSGKKPLCVSANSPKKKIRVAYISPDFRRHVMCFFYQAFLRNYDKESFEVYCYCLNQEDEITLQFKHLVNQWRNLKGLASDEAAQIIYQDEIDILIDLAGHSANNALSILQYKPALVQISGLGYFDTTGLNEVDYFLTDRFVDPVGQHDAYFTEKLFRLSHSHFCYKPWDDNPPVKLAPCLNNGHITFGCFNKYAKITDEAMQIWGVILNSVQGAKLILKSMVYINQDICDEASKRLERHGIARDRIEFRVANDHYMEEFNDVDIMLDTFPYPGGGITCDALYMGVPVITMEGKRHGARFGYSILCNAGLAELTAKTKEAYIEKAIGLAKDTELIDILHRNLRNMMIASPLMDADLYMQEIEAFYKKVILEKWGEFYGKK